MRRDVFLAGFVVTADEWDDLETGVRLQLVSAAHRAADAATAATIAIAVEASSRIPRFDPSDDDGLAPTRPRVDGRAVELLQPYEMYELVESAA
jgi:hypothetical protein